jgi:mannose-6-phosphate isomerase-like protein (cupin superfamily)
MKRIITENGPDGRSRLLKVEDVPPMQLIWETSESEWLGFEPVEPDQTLDFPPGLDANGFHCTPTIDYMILIEGRLRLELDEGSAELAPGDMVVQRSTNHAWRNPDATPAKCIAIVSRPASGS